MYDDLLTNDEAARLLRITGPTLKNWRHQSRGPASFKLGRMVRYRRAEVLRWVERESR